MTKYFKWLFGIVAGFLLLFYAGDLLAHESVEIGPYRLVAGWLHEPALVGERNAVLLAITQADEPVTGAEAGLNAELLYGGASRRSNLTPMETPGVYMMELIPTVRGIYTLQLSGVIGDSTIDTTIPMDEIHSASRLQFPENAPDVRELEKSLQGRIDELDASAGINRWIGIAASLIGLVAIALPIIRKNKNV